MSPRSNGSSSPNGSSASSSRAVKQLGDALAALSKADLAEAFRFWSGDSAASPPRSAPAIHAAAETWLTEPSLLLERVAELGQRLESLFEIHLAASHYECTFAGLATDRRLSYLSSYDLEASLTVLVRRGLLVPCESRSAATIGQRAHAVPFDLGDGLLRGRRAKERGIFDAFTLRGHLDRLYDDPERARKTPASRVREFYKMYSNEGAAVARIERLPEGLRDLIGKVTLEFGGLLPRSLFDRMETELPHWNGRRWGKILEDSLVGTCQRLELGRYGIQHNDETLIVFNEVSLAWLRRVAVPGDPDAPHDEASLGVDLVSNISRFLSFIIDHNVRFTVRGEIFKTTEKRILQELIPNPGRELERSEVLGFIYRFCRERGLIESTGERTFALTSAGREWEPKGLDEKLTVLFDHVSEEREPGGEMYHQLRMRRIFLRILKRVEAGVWYDIMYLPFLARNNYLSSLDELAVDEYFESRIASGHYSPTEDLQRMAWNLVSWVRKRLYLLGMLDLGYDKSGRPVAMRLTRIGSRILGVAPEESIQPGIGNLVVTPDFEVVLFPSEDDAELTHDLDRFAEREKQGHLRHFRISERSVHRALSEGMSLARIFETLENNARTPVPQNVLFSVKDWAGQAGLLYLNEALVVRGENPDHLKRFAQDPGVRPHLTRRLDEHRVQLDKAVSPGRMRSMLRELDYLIELE